MNSRYSGFILDTCIPLLFIGDYAICSRVLLELWILVSSPDSGPLIHADAGVRGLGDGSDGNQGDCTGCLTTASESRVRTLTLPLLYKQARVLKSL